MKPSDDEKLDSASAPQITRRTVIASAALIPIAAIATAPQAQAQAAPVLSAEQRKVLAAFVDRLVPKDALGPSASECGVVDYIEGCLREFIASEKPAILQGLAETDALAKSSQGSSLAELPADKQDAVLMTMDEGRATPQLKAFFTRIRRLTLEGMFGDPSYGGNRNFAGWDLIRYPGAKMLVPAQDQRMSVAPVPYRKELYGKGGSHGH